MGQPYQSAMRVEPSTQLHEGPSLYDDPMQTQTISPNTRRNWHIVRIKPPTEFRQNELSFDTRPTVP
jgi:hypothetical protein